MKKTIAACLMLVLINTILCAQKPKSNTEDPKNQQNEISKLINEFSQQLEEHLKMQPQYKEMMVELDRMKSLKDGKVRKDAVVTYHSKYGKILQNALASSKLDPVAFEQKLSSLSRMFKFIWQKERFAFRAIWVGSQGTILFSLQPGSGIQQLKESKDKISENYCMGSKEIIYPAGGVQTGVAVAIAGTCWVKALAWFTDGPSDFGSALCVAKNAKKVVLKLKFKVRSDAYTLGILGPASAFSGAYAGSNNANKAYYSGSNSSVPAAVAVSPIPTPPSADASPTSRFANPDYAYSSISYTVVGGADYCEFSEREITMERELNLTDNPGKDYCFYIDFRAECEATVILSGYADAHAFIKDATAEVVTYF